MAITACADGECQSYATREALAQEAHEVARRGAPLEVEVEEAGRDHVGLGQAAIRDEVLALELLDQGMLLVEARRRRFKDSPPSGYAGDPSTSPVQREGLPAIAVRIGWSISRSGCQVPQATKTLPGSRCR